MAESLYANLWRKKKIGVVSKSLLKPTLGGMDLVLLGIGVIIGTGIFVLTGIAAANLAGPAVIISFLISGGVCALAALSYAELSSSVGGSGSAYSYAYASIGELMAWIIGWDLALEYLFAVPAVAVGWSGYLQSILSNVGITFPEYLGKSYREGGLFNLPAAGIILVMMYVLSRGVRQSAQLNAGIVIIKLVAIAIFILVAMFNVNPDNWSDFMPYGWFSSGEDGKPIGIIAAASIVFFAYIGFDVVTTATEETKNPQRNLPIGIIGSLTVCAIAYVVVSLLLTGLLPYQELGVAAPMAYALEQVGLSWASALVAVGAISGITSVLLVLYYAGTRLLYVMSRDGLLPNMLSQVSSKSHVPQNAIFVVGMVAALIAGFFPLNELAELINIGTLAAFTLVCLSVVILRKTQPNLKRPYKNPLGVPGALLGAVACLGLMLALPPVTWARLGLWFLLGLVIYMVYGYRNSKLRK